MRQSRTGRMLTGERDPDGVSIERIRWHQPLPAMIPFSSSTGAARSRQAPNPTIRTSLTTYTDETRGSARQTRLGGGSRRARQDRVRSPTRETTRARGKRTESERRVPLRMARSTLQVLPNGTSSPQGTPSPGRLEAPQLFRCSELQRARCLPAGIGPPLPLPRSRYQPRSRDGGFARRTLELQFAR